MTPEALLEKAVAARKESYAPYSGYKVGAAIRTATGAVFTGGNVEVVTYTQTSHAEQNAVVSAVDEGAREFDALAISTTAEEGTPPCAHCRQILYEFCGEDFTIHSGIPDDYHTYTLGDLYPEPFGPEDVLDSPPLQ